MPSYTQLIPKEEMTPGAIGAIRNQIIDNVVAQVSRELTLSPDDLVVRDIRPKSDLQMLSVGTTDATVDRWVYDATTTVADAFTAVVGATKTMADQRYIALFGVRDLRAGVGVHTTAMELQDSTAAGPVAQLGPLLPQNAMVSFIKIEVGGAVKAIWDISCLEAYIGEAMVAFSPSAVLIPQNASFRIYYYFKTTAAGIRANLQLIGVVVEPRGKVISP